MATLREVHMDDLKDVSLLWQSVGWGKLTSGDWEHLWWANPATSPKFISRGWVLEVDGKVVGFLCNLLQKYRFGDRDLLAAIATSLVVRPEHRGHTLKLVGAFCQQRNIDLLLNTTAAIQASKIFQFLKFSPIPQAEYNLSLYWVLHESSFLRSALVKIGFPKSLAQLSSVLSAPFLWVFLGVTGRRVGLRSKTCSIQVLDASGIDLSFSDLWERKSQEDRQLLAYRDVDTLQWHFAARNRSSPPQFVCAFVKDRLLGYLALVRQDSKDIGLTRMRVADIFVEYNDADIIRQLLYGAVSHAVSCGVAVIEVVGMPQAVRTVLREFHPYTLQDQSWPFLYRANDPELHKELLCPERWHASLYDGDGSL